MALNFICPGKTVVYTNATDADIKSGQFVLIGALAGVALVDIAAELSGNAAIEGVYALPKTAGAITQGAKLYFDAEATPVGGTAGSGALTTSAKNAAEADNLYAGKAYAAAADAEATVKIKLNV